MAAEIDEFAKTLVEWVRDGAIQTNDRRFQGNDFITKRWKEAAATSNSPEAFAKVIIPDIVDSTIAHLLGAIDQEVLPLLFTASSGKTIDLATAPTEPGGLSGWYGAEWRLKYTKERVIDDLAFLDEPFDTAPDDEE
jgi:hypothetical protein